MLYINAPPMMLEPATASIAIYLLVETPKTLIKGHNRIIKRPFHYKRKICNWVASNHHTITETVIDETSDNLINIINTIKIINYNPSIFMIIYIMLLIIIILF
jgi:hypothetical protein